MVVSFVRSFVRGVMSNVHVDVRRKGLFGGVRTRRSTYTYIEVGVIEHIRSVKVRAIVVGRASNVIEFTHRILPLENEAYRSLSLQ